MVGPSSFNSLVKSSTESHLSALEASGKALAKSYKCLKNYFIGPYASIVVATEYTLDRTWCNYV